MAPGFERPERYVVTTWLGNVPRTIAYALLLLSGLLSFWSRGNLPTVTLGIGWAALMTLGALASAYGAITGRWMGEYVGMLPLAIAVGVYAIVSPGIVDASIFGSFALGLLGRWMQVNAIRKLSQFDYHSPGIDYSGPG